MCEQKRRTPHFSSPEEAHVPSIQLEILTIYIKSVQWLASSSGHIISPSTAAGTTMPPLIYASSVLWVEEERCV